MFIEVIFYEFGSIEKNGLVSCLWGMVIEISIPIVIEWPMLEE
jgi:hypothetical protein